MSLCHCKRNTQFLYVTQSKELFPWVHNVVRSSFAKCNKLQTLFLACKYYFLSFRVQVMSIHMHTCTCISESVLNLQCILVLFLFVFFNFILLYSGFFFVDHTKQYFLSYRIDVASF